MQQFFCEGPIHIGEDYVLSEAHGHHAQVVRLDHEKVRLVYQGEGFFGECMKKDSQYIVHVEEKDPNMNELGIRITLAAALIRREKFELVLQKATELGVDRIVPFESARCVVHEKKEKSQKLLERWRDIVAEASQQCKRNCIPSVEGIASLKDLAGYRSEINAAAYENAYGTSRYLSEIVDGMKSVTIVIGPEGGFSEEEMMMIQKMGYEAVTLGSRILRAETASVYAVSVCAEIAERMKK
ncbi:MAG: 16S rRNA (uracil(1498)-N(3))-methyltransferase [Erysipelotrichaceae bacterium]|jgi:16S rRNA (uracil1498-N3)-methyltransferase|nr:16S rRNA (uracil(1498)-N(3))-methyltransferase [Erysipelotrichaceae bacterium]